MAFKASHDKSSVFPPSSPHSVHSKHLASLLFLERREQLLQGRCALVDLSRPAFLTNICMAHSLMSLASLPKINLLGEWPYNKLHSLLLSRILLTSLSSSRHLWAPDKLRRYRLVFCFPSLECKVQVNKHFVCFIHYTEDSAGQLQVLSKCLWKDRILSFPLSSGNKWPLSSSHLCAWFSPFPPATGTAPLLNDEFVHFLHPKKLSLTPSSSLASQWVESLPWLQIFLKRWPLLPASPFSSPLSVQQLELVLSALLWALPPRRSLLHTHSAGLSLTRFDWPLHLFLFLEDFS